MITRCEVPDWMRAHPGSARSASIAAAALLLIDPQDHQGDPVPVGFIARDDRGVAGEDDADRAIVAAAVVRPRPDRVEAVGRRVVQVLPDDHVLALAGD